MSYQPRRIRPPNQPDKQSLAHPNETNGTQSSVPMGMLAIGVLILIALLGGVYILLRPSKEETAQTQQTPSTGASVIALLVPTATKELEPTLSPTPSCTSAANYLEVINQHAKRADWEAAATTAETGLDVQGLCAKDRQLLTQTAITYGLKAVYTTKFSPLDVETQQHAVERYLSLKQRAKDTNLEIDGPLVVASQATLISQFPLARVAMEQALTDGEFRPEVNIDTTKMYVSALYGLGKWYTTATRQDPLYQEGLQWLVASDRIADKYHTGQGEASQLLIQLVGDETAWPMPIDTPLLP